MEMTLDMTHLALKRKEGEKLNIERTIERFDNNAEYERSSGNLQGCLDFRQLAEWLRELQAYRKIMPSLSEAYQSEECREDFENLER